MKQPRKLVFREKSVLSAIGLKPENWAVYKEDSDYLYVVHKASGRKRKIIKCPSAGKQEGAQKIKKDSCIIHRK